jgi:hypothetical protein
MPNTAAPIRTTGDVCAKASSREPIAENSRTKDRIRWGEKRSMRNPMQSLPAIPAPPRTRKGKGGGLCRYTVFGKDSCQIRNQAILTKRREHDDEGQNPEGSTAQSGGNRKASCAGDRISCGDGWRWRSSCGPGWPGPSRGRVQRSVQEIRRWRSGLMLKHRCLEHRNGPVIQTSQFARESLRQGLRLCGD